MTVLLAQMNVGGVKSASVAETKKKARDRRKTRRKRREAPQKIGALVDAHGERLVLAAPVEVYGGVEVWLQELEREMRTTEAGVANHLRGHCLN